MYNIFSKGKLLMCKNVIFGNEDRFSTNFKVSIFVLKDKIEI